MGLRNEEGEKAVEVAATEFEAGWVEALKAPLDEAVKPSTCGLLPELLGRIADVTFPKKGTRIIIFQVALVRFDLVSTYCVGNSLSRCR